MKGKGKVKRGPGSGIPGPGYQNGMINYKIPQRGPRGGGRRYPWEKWFSRKEFVLVRGVDFPPTVLVHGMMFCVRMAARRHNIGVSIRVAEDRLFCRTFPASQIKRRGKSGARTGAGNKTKKGARQ